MSKELEEAFKQFRQERVIAPRSGLEPIPPEEKPCDDMNHFPPNYICIPYGMQYRHKCPSCGVESILRSPEVRFSS